MSVLDRLLAALGLQRVSHSEVPEFVVAQIRELAAKLRRARLGS